MALSRRLGIALACCTVAVVAVLVLMSVVTRRTPHVRDLVVDAVNERFRSRLEMDGLAVDAFPKPAITGRNVRVRYNGRTDIDPLLSVESFYASVGAYSLAVAPPLNVDTVQLDGLTITIPPGGLNAKPERPSASEAPKPTAFTAPRRRWLPFRRREAMASIDHILAKRAQLRLMPRDTSKLPRIFDIYELDMRDFANDQPARFTAALMNPKPVGRIDINGTFGPWASEDPHLTPLDGQYVFHNADLNTIKGIAGTLTSEGRYGGTLERIEVQGTTDVPNFTIDLAGQPVHLMTKFEAIVDGTNGNTYLERVDAQIGETLLMTKGAVVRAQDVKGRHIALDIVIDKGRIEDLLQLAIKSAKPIMTGRIDLKTKFLLPAGPDSVVEKLRLQGTFNLAQATFTNVDVQKKITMLSQKGRGDEDGNDGESIVSDLNGAFVLENSSLRFSSLTFGVPGARVQLAGYYDLRSQQMDFNGELLTDASLADMTSGYKSVLARLAQPFFRREGGGSKFPIRIVGPRAKPSFGLNVKRAFLPG